MAIGISSRTDRVLYFDLLKDGIAVNSDVGVSVNEGAVSKSLLNILETEPRSRPYRQREYGASLQQFLFEPIDSTTSLRILEVMESAFARWEPRAKNINITITPKPDIHTFEIQVQATSDESAESISLETTLEKLR
jgi:phage baseplate assembly protein W